MPRYIIERNFAEQLDLGDDDKIKIKKSTTKKGLSGFSRS
ncbi:hypothetical protein SL1157_A0274 [Ruegeria lacuscaerulensis ITI-1157]|nr:hypothetical protein SL1157_A0274 [Ruegeria lacuscaerulensis ITI-1157]